MASLTRSARLLRLLIVGTCVFPLVQACGRSEPGDYLYNLDGTISVAASSSTGGDSSSGGGTRNTSGGANGRSGASTDGGTRNSGGASVGTGGTSTPGGGQPAGGTGAGGPGRAGSGQGGSGVAGTTNAGGAPGNPITCGKQVCDSSIESCCVGLAGAQCIEKNQACSGAVLGCTLNADCPGNDICCIAITGDVSAASSCKSRCDNLGNGRERQLCQAADDCAAPFRYCTATIFGVSVCTRRP